MYTHSNTHSQDHPIKLMPHDYSRDRDTGEEGAGAPTTTTAKEAAPTATTAKEEAAPTTTTAKQAAAPTTTTPTAKKKGKKAAAPTTTTAKEEATPTTTTTTETSTEVPEVCVCARARVRV